VNCCAASWKKKDFLSTRLNGGISATTIDELRKGSRPSVTIPFPSN
jgi:hypothetical protein